MTLKLHNTQTARHKLVSLPPKNKHWSTLDRIYFSGDDTEIDPEYLQQQFVKYREEIQYLYTELQPDDKFHILRLYFVNGSRLDVYAAEIETSSKLNRWYLELNGEPLELYHRNLFLTDDVDNAIRTKIGGMKKETKFCGALIAIVGDYMRYPVY